MSEIEKLASEVYILSEYHGGACITDKDHWSHHSVHKRKPKYWFFFQQFGNNVNYIRSLN